MVNRRRQVSRIVVASWVLLLWLSLATGLQSCEAAVVWSDDFDDGSLFGWSVVLGGFSASSTMLVPTADDSTILHPSTVTSGTWSFDLLWNGTRTAIHFTSQRYTIIFFRDHENNSLIEIREYDFGNYSLVVSVENEFLAELYGTWISIDITLDAITDLTSEINVYVDGTSLWPQGDIRALTMTTSSDYFTIYCSDTTFAFDNIVVSNTVDVTPPPPPIPGFPMTAIILGLGTTLGLSAAIRRQRHSDKETR